MIGDAALRLRRVVLIGDDDFILLIFRPWPILPDHVKLQGSSYIITCIPKITKLFVFTFFHVT